MAGRESVFEFLMSSPVHSPVSCRLNPAVGLLATDTEDGLSPESQGNILTTRLEACSEVTTLVTRQPCVVAFIVSRKLTVHNDTSMLVE